MQYDNGGQVTQPASNLPASLTLTSQGVVEFPNGTGAGTIPVNEELKYVVSQDGKSFDLSISGGSLTEIAVYDSASNEFTWACEPGAPATCPAGGLSPDAGTSSTGSNA